MLSPYRFKSDGTSIQFICNLSTLETLCCDSCLAVFSNATHYTGQFVVVCVAINDRTRPATIVFRVTGNTANAVAITNDLVICSITVDERTTIHRTGHRTTNITDIGNF